MAGRDALSASGPCRQAAGKGCGGSGPPGLARGDGQRAGLSARRGGNPQGGGAPSGYSQRYRAALSPLRRSFLGRTGCGHCPPAFPAAESRSGDLHSGNQPDHRRRARRRGCRAFPDPALRCGKRHVPPRHGPRFPCRRRAAPGPCRTHRSRRLLSPLA